MIEIIIMIAVSFLAYVVYSRLKIDELQKELIESKQQLSVAKKNIEILEKASKERDKINEISAKVDSYTDGELDDRLQRWTKAN